MISRIESVETGAEARVMRNLRLRYESDGFAFTEQPGATALPDFFGGYRPDAIAVRGDERIAIEVKPRLAPTTAPKLAKIKRLFDGREDWRLHVVFTNPDALQALALPLSPPEAIRDRVAEARALVGAGHSRAAFLMGWTLLEAATRAKLREAAGPGRATGTVVETAAMHGLIDPETARGLRDLVALKNRVAHGDLSSEPEAEGVERVLDAVEEALTAEAPGN